MKKCIIFILLSIFILVQCTAPMQNVRWRSALIENDSHPPYTYWHDGIQLLSIEQNGVHVSLSGSQIGQYVYIFVSVFNNSDQLVNLFPAESKLVQISSRSRIEATPLLPRTVRKAKNISSGLLTALYITNVAANTIAIAQTSSKYEKALLERKNDEVLMNYYYSQQQTNKDASDLIGLMLKNHTVYSDEHYYGFIIFDVVENKIKMNMPFGLDLSVGHLQFKMVGRFCDILKYDELDLPQDVRAINFQQ